MVAQIDSEYLRHGLGRSARRLASYALFEGRPATTRGQWVNPAVFAWLEALASFGGSPVVDRPIFVTGLGRSGTTILGLLLSLHRDVGFLNEPKAIWHVVDPRQDVNANYGSGQQAIFRMDAGDAIPEAATRAHRMFARYLTCVRARRLVDKYPEMIFRVPFVRALFPDARFIFIHRNGVDACQSIVRWSEHKGVHRSGVQEDWWGRDDAKWQHLWRQLVLPDPALAAVAALGPQACSDADRAALEWALTMRAGLAQIAAHPQAMIRLRYEDLLAQPRETLAGLLAACELPHDDAVFDYAAKSLYVTPPKPMPSLLGPVQVLFDQTMAELGY